MSHFTFSVPVNALPATLWTLVRDVRKVAGLFSFTYLEDFQTPAADCWQYWRRLNIPSLSDLRWLERTEVTGEYALSFRALAGDLTTFDGQWSVIPTGNTSTLNLRLEYEIPEDVGPPVPEALAEYVMNELFKTICRRVKEAAEEETA